MVVRHRGLVHRVMLASVAILLTLAAADTALRVRQGSDKQRLLAEYPGRSLCTESAPEGELIYRYMPGECGFNSQGYRDRERTFSKVGVGFRIVLIGDSVAEGQGLAPELSLGSQLERRLQSAGLSAEVVLLGRTGYSTSQQLYLLLNEAPRYQPDLVLWSYVLNDPAHPLFHNANGELGRYFSKTRWPLLHFLRKKLFVMKERWRARECPDELHAKLHCVYWEQVEEHVEEIADWSQRTKLPVRMVIHPVFEQGGSFSSYSLEPVHLKLRALFADNRLPTLDLLAAYGDYRPDELNQKPAGEPHDPWHPNELGHSLAAAAIYEWLLLEGALPMLGAG